MIKNCVFQLPAHSKEKMINTFNLQHVLSNNRTSIFQNNDMRFCKEKEIDTLVLGCTHYPLLRKVIGEVMGEKVTLVNPAYETAQELRYVLEDNHILNDSKEAAAHKFYVSDGAEKFRRIANMILPCEIEVEDVAIKSFE